MQKDFHYCMIKLLSEKAGFKHDEAQVIAYASQYVDDAVEHKEIMIDGLPQLDYPRIRQDSYFDPVCTAHRGIQYITGINKDIQRKVYISFHFIPSIQYDGSGRYDYRVAPNSKFAKDIVLMAVKELKEVEGNERTQKLIKLGIALHSFADTWSHQRFSGRHSSKDNNIERINLFEDGEWKSLSHLQQFKLNIIPDVGHSEAWYYPDFSHLKWKYEHDYTGIEYERNNIDISLEAAETIFRILCEVTGEKRNWKEYVEKIKECLSLQTDSIKKKFTNYKRLFPEIDFSYDEEDWRNQSLKGESFNWIDFDKRDYSQLRYRFNNDLKWFYFHIEALKQWQYVMGNIRGDLIQGQIIMGNKKIIDMHVHIGGPGD